MSGTGGAKLGRAVAIGLALALALLLLAARDASAGKYLVAQCGWHVGADADWADTTGGAKFRRDAWCATPAGADPFDGAHLKSFTKGGPTVSGTRFARWRWVAPPGTGITRVSGTWWHVLRGGMEQRLGGATAGGGFEPFARAGATDTTLREFVVGFAAPRPAFEDRLLCARAESKWCSIEEGSWSALRALTLTVEDGGAPGASVGDQLTAGGWRRGSQRLAFSGADSGSGVRFGETLLDGARIALHEYPCAKALIGGQWRGTRMRPCEVSGSGATTIDTRRFSDGRHALRHCAIDFAGNSGCTGERTVGIDNNAPSSPRRLTLAGGDEWRRSDDFDFSWTNPDQGPASPISGVYWQILGPLGFDTGVRFVAARDVASLSDLRLPSSGAFVLRLWLRDEAGNSSSATAVEAQMRLDDVRPSVAFEPPGQAAAVDLPDLVAAGVADEHSGPAGGAIEYRRLGTERWIELPTKLERRGAGAARLLAAMPARVDPGTYLFRARAEDGAGNSTETSLRRDGAQMALRKLPPPPPHHKAAKSARGAPGAKTRLFAQLRWRQRRGPRVTVPFGAGARIAGRLTTATGAGLARRRLRVVSRPSRGALVRRRVRVVRTGAHGGFSLALPSGPSRRVTVSFAGGRGLAPARRPSLALRVRGAAILAAAPRGLRTGESLRLWGRVRARGAPIPRRGKLVAIQYYERDSRSWRPVLVTHSDHSGRFHVRYRFRYVTGAARIRLRAVAMAEERWPYAPGASRPLLVRVSG